MTLVSFALFLFLFSRSLSLLLSLSFSLPFSLFICTLVCHDFRYIFITLIFLRSASKNRGKYWFCQWVLQFRKLRDYTINSTKTSEWSVNNLWFNWSRIPSMIWRDCDRYLRNLNCPLGMTLVSFSLLFLLLSLSFALFLFLFSRSLFLLLSVSLFVSSSFSLYMYLSVSWFQVNFYNSHFPSFCLQKSGEILILSMDPSI